MIKQLLSITLVATALFANAQSFSAKYNFAATTTVSGTTDPTTPPTATGVTFGSFSAVGVGTVSTSNGSFTYDTWGAGATNSVNTVSSYTGAIDVAKYYDVAITPMANYEVTLTDMSFTTRRSSTGPRQFSVRTSINAYATNLDAMSTNTNISVVNTNEFFFVSDNSNTYTGSMAMFVSSAFTSFTAPLNVRFYAWNAESTAGSFRVDSVIFNGSAALATGIAKVNFNLNSNFNVYPVPSNNGVVYIENKNALEVSKIEVLDVLGNVVLTNKNTDDLKIKLNLADVNAGTYFVRMHSGKSVSTKKIVIVK